MTADTQTPAFDEDTYWKSIRVFTVYRSIIAVVILFSNLGLNNQSWLDNFNQELYLKFSTAYFAFSLVAAALTRFRWYSFASQVSLQIFADIFFIVILMFAAGGIKSGLGLLLVIAIAAASLISQGRLALFYASIASIAVLLEQSYQFISWDRQYDDYTQTAMLCTCFFATAWLAHSFASRTYKSERIAAQQQLDLENLGQINALITQEMHDGILVVDSAFRLRHCNEQAMRLLNSQLQQQEEKSLDGKLLEDLAPELQQLTRQWMQGSLKHELNAVKLGNQERELRVRFLATHADRHLGAVIFIEDWSQMQAQAQQIKLAALGRLTANIAHEIRNPLSAISHASQLLQEDERNDLGSQRLLQIINENVSRLDQIVKDVLELNRRDRTNQQPVDLRRFILEFHEQFCQTERIPPQHMQLELRDDPIMVLFDQRHLHQILWNICRNGWRHSQQQPNSLGIFLETKTRARNVSIHIRDDGPGIDKEAQSRLFEPFFTTESTGTGLGLYIAQELSEANAAHLSYKALAQGSQFSLSMKKINNSRGSLQ